LPKAARDWPKLNFITYHACIQPNFFMADTLEEVKAGKLRGSVPNISWTTEYAQLVQDLPNCYAEIGTTWASSVVTFPTIAAHIMGQLLKFMGEDRIVFGSDSVWYGSPQWQIEAFWRFQIPEALRRKYGYPELTESAKRKILGLTSAKLYGIQAVETRVPTSPFQRTTSHG
jgi:predicted TIM-barrel fold metal-dependent hydrolase